MFTIRYVNDANGNETDVPVTFLGLNNDIDCLADVTSDIQSLAGVADDIRSLAGVTNDIQSFTGINNNKKSDPIAITPGRNHMVRSVSDNWQNNGEYQCIWHQGQIQDCLHQGVQLQELMSCHQKISNSGKIDKIDKIWELLQLPVLD
jgi:hypothetical protein